MSTEPSTQTQPKTVGEVRVTFLPLNQTCQVRMEDLPYGDHGEPGSILDVAMHFDIDLEHACGGVCACSTCHVHVIEGMEHLFPENIGRGASQIPTEPPDAGFLDTFGREARPVGSVGDGYIQFVDGNALMALAMQENVVIRLERRPGNYVVATRPLALVWPGNRVTGQLKDLINFEFALGNQRTFVQDIDFGVSQLVEIAIRALSPGVNDPFTAMTCVDHLGSALCRLAKRDIPSPYRYDSKDQLRLITPVFTFTDVTDAAFNQIRQYGRTSTAITIRLLETIAEVARSVHRPEDRTAAGVSCARPAERGRRAVCGCHP